MRCRCIRRSRRRAAGTSAWSASARMGGLCSRCIPIRSRGLRRSSRRLLPRRLGIEARAAALRAQATAAQAADIDAALARLVGAGREAMGELFTAVAFADPKLGALPGFDS